MNRAQLQSWAESHKDHSVRLIAKWIVWQAGQPARRLRQLKQLVEDGRRIEQVDLDFSGRSTAVVDDEIVDLGELLR